MCTNVSYSLVVGSKIYQSFLWLWPAEISLKRMKPLMGRQPILGLVEISDAKKYSLCQKNPFAVTGNAPSEFKTVFFDTLDTNQRHQLLRVPVTPY